MTHEDAVTFISKGPFTISELEKKAGLARSTIQKALDGKRMLTESNLQTLELVLRELGYTEPKPSQAYVAAIINHKGGVGKTTTCLNLGAGLAQMGKRVLVVDIDSQANLSQNLGIREPITHIGTTLTKGWSVSNVEPLPVVPIKENLDLVPSDFRLATCEMELITSVTGIIRLRDVLKPYLFQYDFILIDCPPSLAVFTRNALVAANSAIITVQPERSALEGINNIIDLITEIRAFINPTLHVAGILITLANHRLVIHR